MIACWLRDCLLSLKNCYLSLKIRFEFAGSFGCFFTQDRYDLNFMSF